MTLRIGFAFNQKPAAGAADDSEPPGSRLSTHVDRAAVDQDAGPSPPRGRRRSRVSSLPTADRYAEWDDAATIAAVESALQQAGEVIRLEARADFPQELRRTAPDIVFNIAEGWQGPNRESHVPAICEFYGIPYTASDALTLGLALHKSRAKEVFLAHGVPTPAWSVVSDSRRGASQWRETGAPWIVKPVHEGSSMGIPERAFCATEAAVRDRVAEIAAEYGQPALVEEFLPGREFTLALLGNGASVRVLPPVEIRFGALPAGAVPVYGYEAKWIWDTPDRPLDIFECPAAVDRVLEESLATVARAAYHALGCRDWARIDVRLDRAGRAHVIEVNPLPGILPDPAQNSCFPKAARAVGMGYSELILHVLELALVRYGMRR